MIRENNTLEGQQAKPKWWQMLLKGDYFNRMPRRGDVCEARILSLADQDILVEMEGKRDGVIQPRDLEMVDPEYVAQLAEGDTIPVRVLTVSQHHGGLIVSLRQGLQQQDWLRAKRLLENGELVEVQVNGVNRGGVTVDFGQLRGFVPNSHLMALPRGLRKDEHDQRKEALIGETLKAVVIDVNQRRHRLVLSERQAQQQQRQERLEELYEGALVKGVVRNLVDFGAFVDLGGIDGLIHISELAWQHVKHPKDVLRVGEEIEVYVLDVDRERERVALSRKRVLPDPFTLITERLNEGDVITGVVTNAVSFGLFVDVGEGVEGLVHTSEIPAAWADSQALEPGARVQVKVLSMDPVEQQVALHLERVLPTEEEEEEEAAPLT